MSTRKLKTQGTGEHPTKPSAPVETMPQVRKLPAPTQAPDSYTESDAVTSAGEALAQHQARKPGDYTSQWQQDLSDALEAILNRQDFSYDLEGDALYRQYKDSYVNQGRMAMLDTMGQAAAMTGGYGSSYGQTAGQQAYQGYLQSLSSVVPQLYQLALERYSREGEALSDRYALLQDREDRSYGRYQDALSAWNQERTYLSDQYSAQRGFDYARYRDQVADAQWKKEFEESKRRYDQEWNAKHP